MIIDAFFIIMVLYELYLMFVGPGVPVILGDASTQVKQEEGRKKFKEGPDNIFRKGDLKT